VERPASLKPDRSDLVAIAASGAVAVVLGALSFAPAALADGQSPVTADDASIVRLVSGTSCDARAIARGTGLAADADLDELSVSCTDAPGGRWEDVRRALPAAHACVVSLGDLRQVRADVRVSRDPTEANPYHCRVSRVTPNQLVSRARWNP
jgi:hypothetical protein